MRKHVLGLLMLVSVSAFAQKALAPEKIGKLIPVKIKDFYLEAGAKNSLITLGSIHYSMTQRTFTRGEKSVKILLFDYAEAPVMFNQSVRKFQEMQAVESDSLIHRFRNIQGNDQWETYSSKSKNSRIVTGIHNRFYLTLEGTSMPLDELQKILAQIPVEKFPK